MKLVALTDIHGRIDFPQEAVAQIQHADLVLVAGDITNFGGYNDASKVIDQLAKWNSNIYAVPGNCDRAGVEDMLTARNMNLHATMKRVRDVMFLGIGGCNKTPFRTPREYSEKDLRDFSRQFSKSPDIRHHVMVSHAPPYKTRLDKVFFGFHVGSKAIRQFIESFQPDLVVCGHIHEARGFDYVGKTLVINPGQFPKHYAVIQINAAIEYELR